MNDNLRFYLAMGAIGLVVVVIVIIVWTSAPGCEPAYGTATCQ